MYKKMLLPELKEETKVNGALGNGASPTWICTHQPFLRTFFFLFYRLFLFLATFECNTTSYWLNHTV